MLSGCGGRFLKQKKAERGGCLLPGEGVRLGTIRKGELNCEHH